MTPASRMSRLSSVDAGVESRSVRVAALAERCLVQEVETWPKPGLVSHIDTGSHRDMDVHTFRRSAGAIRPYLTQLVEAGARGEGMAALRRIGLQAERAMLAATAGINTHRGAVFGMGLVCAAIGWRDAQHEDACVSLGSLVAQRWGNEIMGGPRLCDSHGEVAARRYGAGGARMEAAEGWPAVYEVGIPALREGMQFAPGDAEAARVHACFALIAVVEDTNLLHRGGAEGLHFAQRRAQRFLDRGGVRQAHWREHAVAIHRAFVERRLSPGGCADLLAMSLFVHELESRER